MIQFIKTLIRFYIWLGNFFFEMIIYWGDAIAWKILRYNKKVGYMRKGACKQTGVCCQTIGIELPQSWAKRGWVVSLFNGYCRFIHNFYSLGEPVNNILLYECHHLVDKHHCQIYPFRPKICREYPLSTLTTHSRVYEDCGFWFMERNKVGTFEEVVANQQHQKKRKGL